MIAEWTATLLQCLFTYLALSLSVE